MVEMLCPVVDVVVVADVSPSFLTGAQNTSVCRLRTVLLPGAMPTTCFQVEILSSVVCLERVAVPTPPSTPG